MTIKRYSITAAKNSVINVDLPEDLAIRYTHCVENETFFYGTSESTTTAPRIFYLASTDEDVANVLSYIDTVKDQSDNLWHVLELAS